MKTTTKHLSEVVLAVVAVALIVGIILCLATPIGDAFSGIFQKQNQVANGGIWEPGGYNPDGAGGNGGSSGEGSNEVVLLDGDGQIFNDNTPEALSFRSSAPLNTLQSVQVDGVDVDPIYYNTEEGSTIVTLHPEYLKTLDETAHTLSIVSDDGTANASFDVLDAGLYQSGSNYTVLLKSWAELAAEGILNADTGYVADGKEGELVGDLVFPDTFTSISTWTLSSCTGLTGVKIPANVTTLTDSVFNGCTNLKTIDFDEDSKLTTIQGWVFNKCTNLESVNLPKSITELSDYAFKDCASIKSVTFAEGCQLASIGAGAFTGCTSLTGIEIPDSVTTIGQHAFLNCTGLASIEIPDSVTTIGLGAFGGCTGLASVTFGEDSQLTSLEYYSFGGCSSLGSITLPDGLVTIGNAAFDRCTSLVNVVIPDSVTIIDEQAFGDTAIKNIVIPASVTSIGVCSFTDCTSLESVTFAENSQLTTIGTQAFQRCTSLKTVNIPVGATSIGNRAFADCTGPVTIIFEGTTAQWNAISKGTNWVSGTSYTINYKNSGGSVEGEAAGSNGSGEGSSESGSVGGEGSSSEFGLFNASGNILATWDELVNTYGMDVTITSYTNSNYNTVATSPYYVLTNNADLAGGVRLVIPDTVTTIGQYAFYKCTSLTSIEIHGNVTQINLATFRDCTNLKSIELPASVTTFYGSAINGCTGLETITFNGTMAQWNAISKGYNWNGNTGNYTVVCTNGNVAK